MGSFPLVFISIINVFFNVILPHFPLFFYSFFFVAISQHSHFPSALFLSIFLSIYHASKFLLFFLAPIFFLAKAVNKTNLAIHLPVIRFVGWCTENFKDSFYFISSFFALLFFLPLFPFLSFVILCFPSYLWPGISLEMKSYGEKMVREEQEACSMFNES